MKITAEISDADITKAQVQLFLMPKRAKRKLTQQIAARFKSRTLPKILKDGIREEHTIKAGKVMDGKPKVFVKPGSGINVEVGVSAKSRQRGIENFKVSPRSATPSRRIKSFKAETQKGKRVVIPSTFSGRLPQSGTGQGSHAFWNRLPIKRTKAEVDAGKLRQPLKRLVGPSLFVMYKRNQKRIDEKVMIEFKKDVVESVKWATERK